LRRTVNRTMPHELERDSRPARDSLFISCTATALACFVPLLAISSQSFWIDEALTGFKAAQPSLADWWRQMSAEKLSDLQMPLYMLYAWGWAKLFGTGEWALRAANLPWFIGGVLAFAFSFRGTSRLFAALVATLSSFAWFYLDEARPYAMQLAASLLIVASLRRLAAPEATGGKQTRWAWAFCAGIGLLAGTSLLGVFWCGAALATLGVVVGFGRAISLAKSVRCAWLALGVWLLCLAAYYTWTLKVGARASAMATTNWQSAFFIGYELLGFSGLGPGRLEIRDAGLGAFRPHLLPLAFYGACLAALVVLGVVSLYRRNRRMLFSSGIVVLGTLAVLLAAGWVWHFRLLGRHCAPAFVVVVSLLVAGGAEAWQRRSLWPRIILCAFLLAALGSCLSARFATRHRKDDYRAAVAFAQAVLRAGDSVWWSADLHGAEFYGLPISETPESRTAKALWIANPTAESLAGLALPNVAVCSKPDLYDVGGALAERLVREHFRPVGRFTAFTVWARPP